MQFALKDILSIIVIFQLLFLFAFLSMHRRGKRISNILLGIFFLSLCLNFTDGILILNNAYVNHPSFAFIGNNFSLLFGPLLFLYVKSVIYKDFKLKPFMLLHIIPFLVLLIFSVLTYHLQSGEMKLFILSSVGKQEIPAVVYLIGSSLYIQFYAYCFASLKMITNFRISMKNQFSELNKINLDWLHSTVVFFMIVIGIGMLNSFIPITPLTQYFSVTLFLIIVALFLFINRVLFKALRQPEIFEGIREEKEDSLGLQFETVKTVKYASSSLSEIEKDKVKTSVLDYMEKEKPFLEPQLTLEELADMLKLKPKILSQVINECLNQNFFDFINRYRIEEAKKLLINSEDKKITVLEVLYKVGFNSKSSFNTLFKKYTGVTPSEFKKTNTPI